MKLNLIHSGRTPSQTGLTTRSQSGMLRKHSRRAQAGFTLIEISLVIGLILVLITAAVIGFNAYREGANKSLCILNISNVQKAVRSYQNMNGLNAGDALLSTTLIGAGKMLEVAPTCKTGGTYTYTGTVPAVGTAYTTCSASGHAPASTSGW